MKRSPINKVSQKQKNRNSTLAKMKQVIMSDGKVCALCGHPIFPEVPDLVHIIRRSYSQELQDDPRNLIIGHRHCHDLFDNNINSAVNLRFFWDVLKRMQELDEQYYLRYISRIHD